MFGMLCKAEVAVTYCLFLVTGNQGDSGDFCRQLGVQQCFLSLNRF